MVIEIIVAVVVFLFFVPLKFTFMFYINLLHNKGAIVLNMWGIHLLAEKFLISDGEITARNKRNKETKIELTKEDKKLIFLNLFINSIIRKIVLRDTYICAEVGKKDNAMATAVISGAVLFMIDLIFAQIFSRKAGSYHTVDNDALFCQNKLSLSVEVVFSITLFDALFSFVKSLLKAHKRIKELNLEKQKNETKVNVGN